MIGRMLRVTTAGSEIRGVLQKARGETLYVAVAGVDERALTIDPNHGDSSSIDITHDTKRGVGPPRRDFISLQFLGGVFSLKIRFSRPLTQAGREATQHVY